MKVVRTVAAEKLASAGPPTRAPDSNEATDTTDATTTTSNGLQITDHSGADQPPLTAPASEGPPNNSVETQIPEAETPESTEGASLTPAAIEENAPADAEEANALAEDETNDATEEATRNTTQDAATNTASNRTEDETHNSPAVDDAAPNNPTESDVTELTAGEGDEPTEGDGTNNSPEDAITANDDSLTVETPRQDDTTSIDLDPIDDLSRAMALPSVLFTGSGSLTPDTADLYQFTVDETGIFTADLTDLSADADVQLIQDQNTNGQVDPGEIIAWEWERNQTDESIRHFLQSGDYVLRVLERNISPLPTEDEQNISPLPTEDGQNSNPLPTEEDSNPLPTEEDSNPLLTEEDSNPLPTEYTVITNFTPAATDDLAFSIEVIYKLGSEQLNANARIAVERAASYWENIISHSSFGRPLELALGIYGTTNTTNRFLAYAGPQSYRNIGDERDTLLPVVGVAVLNNYYIDDYNESPDYLEAVLRHEIGHVLGLGVLWDQRGNDLVDQDEGTYRADTYAGQSYGELIGTGVATAIPLDRDSLTHWDEEIFDTELLTPRAEGIGNPMPLSPLTISSLRDLGWHVNYGAAEAFVWNGGQLA